VARSKRNGAGRSGSTAMAGLDEKDTFNALAATLARHGQPLSFCRRDLEDFGASYDLMCKVACRAGGSDATLTFWASPKAAH